MANPFFIVVALLISALCVGQARAQLLESGPTVQESDDPQLVASKAKILGEYPQATGKDAVTLYRVATQVSPASRYWVREHLVQNYGVKFE